MNKEIIIGKNIADSDIQENMVFEEKESFRDKFRGILYSNVFRAGIIVLVILLVMTLYIMNRMIIVRIQYDIDGVPVDHRAEEVPFIGLGDEGEGCFGFGKCLESEKIFVGFDPDGVSIFRLEDTCYVDGEPRDCYFSFSFSKKKHHFRDETFYIHFTSDGNGGYTCSADCSNVKTSIETTVNDGN